MDSVAIRVFAFSILPVIIAVGHLSLDKSSRPHERRLEIFLLYLFGVGVAGSGIGGFFGHVFLSDSVAESIGWPTGNPFQLEVGVANLAVGILGVVAMGRRDGFREATVLAATVFGVGATVVHVMDVIESGNLAPGNTIQNISNLLRPSLLIAFLAASRRAERSPDSEAQTAGFDQWREPRIRAAGLMTGSVAAGFGAGFAIDLPLIGTLVGTLVGVGLAAFIVARSSSGSSGEGVEDHHADPETTMGEGVDPRGRSCPLAYRYQPEALAQPAQLEADTLHVVGGLYGNPAALAAVLERAHQEPGGPATIVFNGDFHWLDVDPDDFQEISKTVLAHHATKGNVEAELASEDETAGCGCAYPDYIDDDTVDRSNQIITRLRETARRFPDLVGRLGELPRHLTASVGGQRVGILHGDPESLAGWRLALEAMEPGDPDLRHRVGWRGRPTTTPDLLDWFGRAKVRVFVSTHTGLPFAQVVADGRQGRLVINNGSAGLACFAGTTYGIITRLSSSQQVPADSLYGTTIGALRCDALPVRFDPSAWQARFLAQWPPGSPGHRAYSGRITSGTHLRLEQAARGGVELGPRLQQLGLA